MKKKILSLMLILAMLTGMLFVFTGCGNDNNGEEKESKSSSKNKDDEDNDIDSEVTDVVESFIDCISKNQFSKAFEFVDWTAYTLASEGCEHDEIESDYDDLKEEYSEDIEYFESVITDIADSFEEEIENYEIFKIELKNMGDAEKEKGTDDVYSVEVEVKTTIQKSEDDEKETETETYEFFVMKKDDGYYLIDGIDDFMNKI